MVLYLTESIKGEIMKDLILKGKIWVITDKNGRLISDIDTDQIFHNAFLHITEIDKMASHAFGNLEGWKDFPEKCSENDIILTGKNFGSGSSRQQAVDCFKALGIGAVISESFGAIYKRNAINSGFPILTFPDADVAVSEKRIKNLDKIELDLSEGRIRVVRSGEIFEIVPLSKVQKDILKKNSLLSI